MLEVEAQIEVNKPIEEVWRFFENFKDNIALTDSNVVRTEQIKNLKTQRGTTFIQKYRGLEEDKQYIISVKKFHEAPNRCCFEIEYHLDGKKKANCRYQVERISEERSLIRKIKIFYGSNIIEKIKMKSNKKELLELQQKQLIRTKLVIEDEKYIK